MKRNGVRIWHVCSRCRAPPVSERRELRIEALLGLLRGGGVTTAAALADGLGVSLRTVRRDLAALGARGAPLEAEPGRGGGVRLPASWGLGRLHLGHREILDVLLALAIGERLRSPLLLSSVRGVRQKLALAFPPAQRARVEALRRRILVGEPASVEVREGLRAPRAAVVAALQDAFFGETTLGIRYRDASGAATERIVEPHHLLLNWPAWYALVHDRLRSAARTFRLDRIEEATARPERFRTRPADELLPGATRHFSGL